MSSSTSVEALSEAARWNGEVLVRLRNALNNNRLVIIVGAGVTLSATADISGRPLPRVTWTGLIRNGLEYLTNKGYVDASNRRIRRAYDALEDSEADSVLDAANIMTAQLIQHHQLSTWLELAFGSLHQGVRHPAVLEVLKALHGKGATLLTTNYDDILEKFCDLRRIGRSNLDEILKFKRGDLDGVFHIHGSYHDPHEVVLDSTNYYQITHSDEVQNILRNFLEYKIILFVGCGSGLEDPHFSVLLKWASERQENIPNRHCILIRKGDTLNFKSLVLLEYGSDYQDLVPFLNKLLDDPAQHAHVARNTTEGRSPAIKKFAPMASGWDLIEYFKLESTISPDYVKHTFSVSDRARGQRKVTREETWERQNKLGQGISGEVWLEMERRSKKERAVKEIRKVTGSASRIDYYKGELLAMAKLSKYQEVFVHFYGWFETGDTIFLAMEYFPLSDLQGCINDEIAEDDAKIITGQLLEGVKILHDNGFTHRDLKPQNIFVVSKSPDWWVKIGDFGLTKRIETHLTALRTYVGTQHFQAPEILGYVIEESLEYTNAVDMWSLGCVAYELLTQNVPFASPRDLSLFCRGITFIEGLMVPEPSKRLTADAASRAAWLVKADAVLHQTPPRGEVLQLLREGGYDIEADGVRINDALIWASKNGHETAVRLLFEMGADIAAKATGGRTALHLAAGSGYQAVVRLLLEKGADIAATATGGRTALHRAATGGHEAVARLLTPLTPDS